VKRRMERTPKRTVELRGMEGIMTARVAKKEEDSMAVGNVWVSTPHTLLLPNPVQRFTKQPEIRFPITDHRPGKQLKRKRIRGNIVVSICWQDTIQMHVVT